MAENPLSPPDDAFEPGRGGPRQGKTGTNLPREFDDLSNPYSPPANEHPGSREWSGDPSDAVTARTLHFRSETWLKAIGVIQIIGATIIIGVGIFGLLAIKDVQNANAIRGVFLVVLSLIALISYALGAGLLGLKRWARTLVLIFSALALLGSLAPLLTLFTKPEGVKVSGVFHVIYQFAYFVFIIYLLDRKSSRAATTPEYQLARAETLHLDEFKTSGPVTLKSVAMLGYLFACGVVEGMLRSTGQ